MPNWPFRNRLISFVCSNSSWSYDWSKCVHLSIYFVTNFPKALELYLFQFWKLLICVRKLKLDSEILCTVFDFLNQFFNKGSIIIDGKRILGVKLNCRLKKSSLLSCFHLKKSSGYSCNVCQTWVKKLGLQANYFSENFIFLILGT